MTQPDIAQPMKELSLVHVLNEECKAQIADF